MTNEIDPGTTPGMPCPQCGGRIEISIRSLLAISAVRCPSCDLELTVDAEESEAALDALRRYSSQIDSIRRDRAS